MNILIDCGTHLGEGLAHLIEQCSMAEDAWKVFSFEPNIDSYNQVVNAEFKIKNIEFINKAVWVYDGDIIFHAETPPDSLKSDGAGSSLIGLDEWTPKSVNNPGVGDFDKSYSVGCISLARFILSNCTTAEKVILKLDIEGAEFDVLEDLIKTGAVKLIDDLYIEFHEWAMKSKTIQLKNALIGKIKKSSKRIKVKEWF